MGDDSQENLIDPNVPKLATVAEVIEGLSDFDLTADDHKRSGQSPANERRAVVEAKRAELAALKHENQRDGWISQGYDDVDAWRAGEGKDAYNAARRANYADLILKTEGRMVRPRQKATPERRKGQNADAQAKRRQNMTPEQKKDESRKHRERRQNAKAEITAKLKDGAIV